MEEVHNMSAEGPAGGAYQEVRETGETTYNEYDEASGRGSVQHVQEALNEIIEGFNQDDEEIDALLEAANKEFATVKERRDTQHKKKVNIRQQLAQAQFEHDKEEQWIDTMERRVDDIAVQFQELEKKCEDLATNHSRYANERARSQMYAQCMCQLVEASKKEIESRRSKFDKEIEELRQTLREDQAMTNALLNVTDDEDEEYRKLNEESGETRKGNRELEIKTEIELARQKEIQARTAAEKEQLAKEEEISKQNGEMEPEMKRKKHQEIDEKKALLLTLQRKKEDNDRQKKEQLEAVQARHNSLRQENFELKAKVERKKKSVRKELEQGVKELVVVKHEIEVKQAEMLQRKFDLEEQIRQKTNRISDIRKSKKAAKARSSRTGQEIDALGQETLLKKAKIADAKNILVQVENEHQSLVQAQEKIKNEIEERKNMCAREELLYTDKIEMEAIEIENLTASLLEGDEMMAHCQFEQNILEEELETLLNEVDDVQKLKTARTAFAQSKNKYPTGVPDEFVELEEQKRTLRKQIKAVSKECSNAEQLRDSLKSHVAEQKAALEKAQAEAQSQDQNLKLLDSKIESTKTMLVAKQERVKEVQQKLEKEKENISSLIEMKESLDTEIRPLPASQDGKKRITKLEKQIKDTDQKIEATRNKIDTLNSSYEDATKSLEEEQKAGDVKATEEEISSLKKRSAALKDEVKGNIGKLEGFRKVIADNTQKGIDKEKRVEDAKKNLEILQGEVAALKLRFEEQEKDAPRKEAEQKAQLEAILAEFGALKTKAAEKTHAFRDQEKYLLDEIKKTQQHLKKLLSERPPSPESPPINTTRSRAISEKGWLTMTQSKHSVFPANEPFSLAGLTQRAPQDGEQSPSTESSVGSIELSKEDIKAVRSGKTTVWKIAASQNKTSQASKKGSRSQN